jgi:uroporphyrinogen decarboxylase
MTHRDRILAAIRHQPVDRFPTDIWATPEVWQRLKAHFRTCDHFELLDRLGVDGIIGISPRYIGPELKTIDGIRYDEWGMGYRPHRYGSGVYDEQVIYPLAGAETIVDLEKYPWPSADWYDYGVLASSARVITDRAVEVGYTAPFYFHNKLRGLEQSLVDPLEKPEFTRYLIGCISDFFTEYHRRCFETVRGLAHTTQVTDDFGSQHGLLISPKVFDGFYRSAVQRGIDLAHEYGLIVFHHDDGDCRKLLPRLVEMGIELLNPIQWRCGSWDLKWLKETYGERVCFHSAVDNQYTLPFGTLEEVRSEVKMLKATLGCDGTGLIIGPCHNIQPLTPIENILALYQAALET